MISLRIYDDRMNFMGEVDNMTSLIWTRRYTECGEFQIVAPVTPDNIRLLKRGRLVWKRGAADCGLIEGVTIEETQTDYRMTVVGRHLVCLLAKGVLSGSYIALSGKNYDRIEPRKWTSYSKNTQSYNVPNLITDMLNQSTKPIPVELKYTADVRQYGAEYADVDKMEISFKSNWENAYDHIVRINRATGRGLRVQPDFEEKRLTFLSYMGADKSSTITFSKKFDNMTSAVWTEDSIAEAKQAFVCFDPEKKEDDDDEDDDGVANVPKNSNVFQYNSMLDAIVRVDFNEEYDQDNEESRFYKKSYDSYILAAKAYASEQLKTTYAAIESMECEVSASTTYVYGKDYDLGDIVTVRHDDWGIEQKLRLTEVSEIYENGVYKLAPVFGNPAPETVDWDKI